MQKFLTTTLHGTFYIQGMQFGPMLPFCSHSNSCWNTLLHCFLLRFSPELPLLILAPFNRLHMHLIVQAEE